MNKLFLILLLFVSSISFGQNSFFWSHNFIITYTNVKYGFMYNWYAITEPRKITSSDTWRVASTQDFFDLCEYIDDYESYNFPLAGGYLKETGFTHWYTPNEGATNIYNFNARGTGYREGVAFVDEKYNYYIGFRDTLDGLYQAAAINATVTTVEFGNLPYQAGFAVRIVRNATLSEQALTDGTYVSDYHGNNLYTYKCVKIGAQVWISTDLAETKYRNGDWIDGYNGGVYTPIVGAAWDSLITGALSAYDDNESNVITP